MEKKMNREEVAAVRHGVNVAFGALRKIGFITKTNFSCCMTCAVAELTEIAEKQRRNRAVYWHQQDETHFKKSGILDIRYCYLQPQNLQGETNGMEKQIGEQVAEALRKAGLAIDWNGDPSRTIEVVGMAAQPDEKGCE
jgi:hypothetical protein